MLGFFGPVAKWMQKKRCLIDNTTFKLHYQVTFVILGASSLLTTARQFFGDPISCIVDNIDKGIFQTYCWIHGTFTLPSYLVGKEGQDFAHPGVGPLLGSRHESGYIRTNEDGEEIRHAWYQWVCFILFIQATMCYIPHFLWKNMEGGRIGMLLQGLDAKSLENKPAEHKEKRDLIVKYVVKHLQKNNLYAIKFFACEFLNFINIVGQMYLMDSFLGGTFTTYGIDVLSISNREMEDRIDPMARTFPKMAKCTFHKYGPSGTIQNHDGLCILPINIIIEKIYVFLWFWYVALAVWTGIFLVYRIATIASRRVRFMIFKSRARKTHDNDLGAITDQLYLGDWVMLMQLAKNINEEVFVNLLDDLKDNLDPKRRSNMEMENGNSLPNAPMYSTVQKH